MKGRCFIHAGTHKTGSTSLQALLTGSAATFAAAKIYVPESGRPATGAESRIVGHHNLAWQLTGDRRFDERFGTLRELTRELEACGLPTAVLSSEDFILAHDRTSRLAELRDACLAADYEPAIVAYLRGQSDYATSLYAHFVVRGKLPASFAFFERQILNDGTIGWANSTLLFDYDALLEPFRAVFGTSGVIARPYWSDAESAVLIHDFTATIGAPASIARELPTQTRLNAGHSWATVLDTLHQNISQTRHGLPSPASIAACIGVSDDALARPFAPLDSAGIAAFAERFHASNAAVLRDYAIEIERSAADASPGQAAARAIAAACHEAWQP